MGCEEPLERCHDSGAKQQKRRQLWRSQKSAGKRVPSEPASGKLAGKHARGSRHAATIQLPPVVGAFLATPYHLPILLRPRTPFTMHGLARTVHVAQPAKYVHDDAAEHRHLELVC